MQDPAFLEIRGLKKSFGGTQALAGIDLVISEGEFVTLLGPSGCGKTTTLRLIGGFERPDEGEIRFAGRVVSSPGGIVPPDKRNLGMVFQSFAVWPHMRVIENITLPMRMRGYRKEDIERRCDEVLRLCRIDGHAQRYPHELSGGQLQRVALARTLAYEPKVVLLDEPLSNLDVALREELRREIRAIHQKIGTTFLLVTHDQEEALLLSDRVVVMNGGRIEQVGTPHEVYNEPKSTFVSQFVSGANRLSGRIAAIEKGQAPARLYVVKVGDFELKCHSERNWTLGDECTLVIQPEGIRCRPVHPDPLSAPVTDAANLIRGVIEDVSFRGRIQEVLVNAAGTTLRVVALGRESFSRRQDVVLSVSPDAIRFM